MKGSASVAIKRILFPLAPVRDAAGALAVATLGSFARSVGSGSVIFWPVHATWRRERPTSDATAIAGRGAGVRQPLITPA